MAYELVGIKVIRRNIGINIVCPVCSAAIHIEAYVDEDNKSPNDHWAYCDKCGSSFELQFRETVN